MFFVVFLVVVVVFVPHRGLAQLHEWQVTVIFNGFLGDIFRPSCFDLTSQRWLWVKKKTQTGTTGFGLLFLSPIGFFRYPFLTHSQIQTAPWGCFVAARCFAGDYSL